MKKYFFHNGQEQVGPLTIEELKAYSISRNTQVWFEGLPAWQPAGIVEELKSIFLTPPPLKQVLTPKQELATPPNASYQAGNLIGRKIWFFVILVLLIPIAIYFYNRNKEQNAVAQKEFSKEIEDNTRKNIRDNITSYVYAERSSYQFSSLGGIANLSISVTNNTPYLVDKVKVRVDYLKPDGSKWDDKVIEFNLVSPHTKVTLPVENTERGVSVRYEVISINSSDLGL